MNTVVELPKVGLVPAAARLSVAEVVQHAKTVQEVMQAVMRKDVHYGVIPFTDKPTLYKAGAEVLCMTFRIADSYIVDDLSTADVVRYRVTCVGRHQTSGAELGSGMGEGSTGEEKYKWRKAVCAEEFAATPANMRRVKFAKGKGGSHYTADQVRTEPADLANTVLKMACKRAKMAMVLNVTAASDCFTQDLEDLDATLQEHLTDGHAAAPPPASPAPPPSWPDESFNKRLPKWQEALAAGQTHDAIIAFARSKGALTAAQEATIRALRPADITIDDLTELAAQKAAAAVRDPFAGAAQ